VTATSAQDFLIRTYRAFNARDIDAALAVMHPEVDWPNGLEGGRVHGHARLPATAQAGFRTRMTISGGTRKRTGMMLVAIPEVTKRWRPPSSM
jgi:hypothetical protein